MKRTRSIMLAAILLLSAMVVFAGTAAADDPSEEEDPFKIYGTITDADGNPVSGAEVRIEKKHTWLWVETWTPLIGYAGYSPITDADGNYSTGWCKVWHDYGLPIDRYRMYVDGELVGEKRIRFNDWDNHWTLHWSHRWDYQIPEFATIAIPAIALLGLYAFYRRKPEK